MHWFEFSLQANIFRQTALICYKVVNNNLCYTDQPIRRSGHTWHAAKFEHNELNTELGYISIPTFRPPGGFLYQIKTPLSATAEPCFALLDIGSVMFIKAINEISPAGRAANYESRQIPLSQPDNQPVGLQAQPVSQLKPCVCPLSNGVDLWSL